MRDRGVRSFQGCELPDPSHRAPQDGLDAATESSTTLLSCHIESLRNATTAKNDASQYWHILIWWRKCGRESGGPDLHFCID